MGEPRETPSARPDGARVAVIENGTSRDAGCDLVTQFESAGFQIEVFWAYGGEWPEDQDRFDAVLLSGSPHGAYEDIPFIHREHEFIRACAARRTPMLGVCFGSQILASALCGRDQVFRRSTCEVGYKWLDATGAGRRDPLTRGAGARMWMFVWHNDEVRGDHPDMNVLATTGDCPNHVWRFRDEPIWGIQGHPEVTKAASSSWFEGRRGRLAVDGADVDGLLAEAGDSVAGLRMLENFMRHLDA